MIELGSTQKSIPIQVRTVEDFIQGLSETNDKRSFNIALKITESHNKYLLSQLETQNTSSSVLFIYKFQLREFRFVLYDAFLKG